MDRAARRPVARLRGLLVALLVAGVALVALGAVSHAHVHVHSHDHASIGAASPTVDETPATAPIAPGPLEAEGICLAVTLVALVLLTILRPALGHRMAAAPRQPPPPGLPAPHPVPGPSAPDLAQLAVCRQ